MLGWVSVSELLLSSLSDPEEPGEEGEGAVFLEVADFLLHTERGGGRVVMEVETGRLSLSSPFSLDVSESDSSCGSSLTLLEGRGTL